MSLRSLNVRLTVVFSAVFVTFAALLFVATHMLLDRSLRQDERTMLNSRLLAYWSVYRYGGLLGVRREMTLEKIMAEGRPFLLRISGPGNERIYFLWPKSWEKFNLRYLEEGPPPEPGEIIEIHSTQDAYRLIIASVELPDGNILQFGISNGRRIDLLQYYRRIFLIVAVPLVVLSLVGGFVFATRSLSPISALSTLTRDIIDTGRLTERIPVSGTGDELDDLSDLFNRMLGRIELLVEGMRESLDNVAHDLRTPLTRLRGNAEMALRAGDECEATRETLETIIEESRHILTMLNTLMDISEAESGIMHLQRRDVNIVDIVRDMSELYSYSAEEKNVEIACETPESAVASVDVDRIRQVTANLLDNAVKYTESGGRITVRVMTEPGTVTLAVEDTGMGIEERDLPYIWQRLYRADKSRSRPGLGLGLGLVRAVVQAHGGDVSVRSAPGVGSRFSVTLPRG